MSIKVLTRQLSVLVYDDARESANYVASCQVLIDGDEATIFTVNGRAFYSAIARTGVLSALMHEHGVTLLRGVTVPAYARMLQSWLGGEFEVRLGRACEVAGHQMVRLELTPLAVPEASLDEHVIVPKAALIERRKATDPGLDDPRGFAWFLCKVCGEGASSTATIAHLPSCALKTGRHIPL